MSYGIQIAASGLMTAMYRQDVYANNLANMDSVGFKADLPTSRPRPDVIAEDGVGHLPSNDLLRRLGGGSMLNANMIEFSQGPVRPTGNALDVAIEGDGFLAVRDVTGSSGDSVRLTRDGRMTRDKNGRLVMATTGLPILDVQGNSIQLGNGAGVEIDGNGTIRQGGSVIAQLQFVDVSDERSLSKQGASLFRAPTESLASRRPASGTIRQRHVEESSVDEITALMKVTGASRDVDLNTSMIQQHDRLLERAINGLGRPIA